VPLAGTQNWKLGIQACPGFLQSYFFEDIIVSSWSTSMTPAV
jgi:hypothetical protein